MTYRPPETYVHTGPVVVVPGRIAAWLHERLQLDNVWTNVRGRDPEVDALLNAIISASHHWRAAVGGNVAAQPTARPAPSPYMTTSDAAVQIGIGKSAVRMAIRQGRLPAERVDGRWRIDRAEVEHYRAAQAARRS